MITYHEYNNGYNTVQYIMLTKRGYALYMASDEVYLHIAHCLVISEWSLNITGGCLAYY